MSLRSFSILQRLVLPPVVVLCILPAVYAALIMPGCSRGPKPTLWAKASITYQALVVDEIRLESNDTDAFEAFKRTGDMLDTLWQHTSWRIIEPNEFNWDSPQASTKAGDWLFRTDLVKTLAKEPLDAKQFLFVRVSVSARTSHGGAETSKGAKKARRQDFNQNLALRLEAFNAEGQTIARFDHDVLTDPFAEHPDYDSRPVLQSAVRDLTWGLIEQCGDCIEKVVRPPWPLHINPGVVLQALDHAGQTPSKAVRHLDEIDQEQHLWRHLQYIDPQIGLATVKMILRAPSGVCLGKDTPPPFQPYDCLFRLGSTGLRERHRLVRQLQRGPLDLEVIGLDGHSRLLKVKWP
jgi:hypothetical protein